jgi:formylglycine-generating enzyme required for sulfatase activity/predicted Ser/Thr protein kinase
MSGFLKTLDAHLSGSLSREQLFSEVERLLDSREADLGTLLAQVYDQQVYLRLAPELRSELVRKLIQHGSARVAATTGADEDGFGADPDDAATVIFEGGVPLPGAAAPSPQLRVGSVLKRRFRLIELIGVGGMSAVYKAIDMRRVEARASNTLVAVKLLTFPAGDFTRALEVLQHEAHQLEVLRHPNIVRVFDCDRHGPTVFMTMEYLSGQSLRARMRAADSRGFATQEALRIIGAIASGLSFAHARGIVHGDLKPANVIITDDGEVKIIDFGIARFVSSSPPHGEQSQLSALTPAYASPEMLLQHAPDARDDIYALACIAHELLTGSHPFGGRTALEAQDERLQLGPHKALSSTQQRAIAHGLLFARERRTPSADLFAAELRGHSAARTARLVAVIGVAALLWLAAAGWLLQRLTHSAPGHVAPAAVAGSEFRDCAACPLIRVLPAGRFTQGSAAAGAAGAFEQPAHAVSIARPFGLGVYEVSVAEFAQYAASGAYPAGSCETYDRTWAPQAGRSWSDPGFTQGASYPVACVSWRDAQGYAAWLSQKTGKHYRLPSESEWEYAARAGSALPYPWSEPAAACADANLADRSAEQKYPGWTVEPCSDGYVYSAPVGSFRPNAFGLYDMLGNVAEWVADCWHCSERGLRGGSWFTSPERVSVSARNRFPDDYRSNSVGFRLVRELEQ